MRGPSPEEREYCIVITAQLMHLFPLPLFFATGTASKALRNPFPYVFIQVVIIDAQAAFSSLIEQHNSSIYADLVRRQAACFDIIVAYLTYLSNTTSLNETGLDSNLLLRLRNDIGVTFQLSLEFLQEVWNLSQSGFVGSVINLKEKHQLACSTAPLRFCTNPVITSIMRALSLWLQEDDSLRKDAACITHLLLDVWKTSELRVEFRSWIVAALDGITDEEPGRIEFLCRGGWDSLWNHVKFTYEKGNRAAENDVYLSIEAGRLLGAVMRAERIADIGRAKEVIRTIGPVSNKTDKICHLKLRTELCILSTVCVMMICHSDRMALQDELTELRNAIEDLQAVSSDGVVVILEEWMAKSLKQASQELRRQ